MTNEQMARDMAAALQLLKGVHEQLNDAGDPCECCGMVVRENFEEYQQKQVLGGAIQRVEKSLQRLESGRWPGRQLVDVTDASDLRGGS